MSFPYLLILLGLPLVGSVALAWMRGAEVRTVKLTALAISIVEFAFAVGLWFDYRSFLSSGSGSSGTGTLKIFTDVSWIPTFGIHFSLGTDGISLVMIALTAFLTPIVLGFSWHERLPEGRTIGGYFSLVLALEFALIGVFAAADVFLFYFFFEVMLIPMYFLIGYFGGPRRAGAAMKFFIYSLAGSLLMLAAMIGLYVASTHVLPSGTLDWQTLRSVADQIPESTQVWIFAGFGAAFAIKAPLVPLHTWLPYAGAEAPTGTSTLLVTLMDKVGTFGFLRICLPLLPAASHDYAWLLLVMAVVGILYGAIVAAGQTDLKRFVTYTSIAHFGFIALGIFAFTTQAMTGAVLYMVNHGITTGLLFLIIGMLINRGRSRFVRDYGGVWKVAPILGGVFMVATMATIALPGTNSFISEFLVLIGTFRRSIAWGTLGTVGIILAAVYMLWIYQQTMTGPIRGKAVVDDDEGPTAEPVYSAAELSQMGPAGSVLPEGSEGSEGSEGAATATATAVHPLVRSHKTRFGDLKPREIAVVAPLVAAIVFLGLYPTPVLDVIKPTVVQTMTEVGSTNPPPAVQVGAASAASSEGGN